MPKCCELFEAICFTNKPALRFVFNVVDKSECEGMFADNPIGFRLKYCITTSNQNWKTIPVSYFLSPLDICAPVSQYLITFSFFSANAFVIFLYRIYFHLSVCKWYLTIFWDVVFFTSLFNNPFMMMSSLRKGDSWRDSCTDSFNLALTISSC